MVVQILGLMSGQGYDPLSALFPCDLPTALLLANAGFSAVSSVIGLFNLLSSSSGLGEGVAMEQTSLSSAEPFPNAPEGSVLGGTTDGVPSDWNKWETINIPGAGKVVFPAPKTRRVDARKERTIMTEESIATLIVSKTGLVTEQPSGEIEISTSGHESLIVDGRTVYIDQESKTVRRARR